MHFYGSVVNKKNKQKDGHQFFTNLNFNLFNWKKKEEAQTNVNIEEVDSNNLTKISKF